MNQPKLYLISVAQTAQLGPGRLIVHVFRLHTLDTHTRWDSSERVIIPSQRPLAAQHTTTTTDDYPRPQRDSNRRFQQPSGFRRMT